jgi:hypothetical protein
MQAVFARRWFRRLLIAALAAIAFLWAIHYWGSRINAREVFRISYMPESPAPYDSLRYAHRLDSLRDLYGPHKHLPERYALPALLALAHYPELRTVPIHFFEEPALFPLASRPDPRSLFRRRENRRYHVIISTETIEALQPALLERMPFDAQVGIIGHELAHTVSYLDKSSLEVLVMGLNYALFPSFRATFESNTDRRTVMHGLGPQLMQHTWNRPASVFLTAIT